MAATCPRDGAALREVRAKGKIVAFAVDECPSCNGTWFDRGEVSRATGDKEVERLIVKYAAGDSGLACPRCGREMAVRPVGEVTLDVCRTCKGVWVDAAELESAARTLGSEFSDVTSASEIGTQVGEFPGSTRQSQIARVAFAGMATPTLRYLLKPKITRRYPRERL